MHAADVNIFGINTTDGHWAVYARISNPNSEVAGQLVSGLSSLNINVVNPGPGGPTVLTSVNNLPRAPRLIATTFSARPMSVMAFGCCEPMAPSALNPSAQEPLPTGRSGAFGIVGGQYSFPDTTDPNNNNAVLVPYSQLVLSGVGLTGGSQAVDSKRTGATSWSIRYRWPPEPIPPAPTQTRALNSNSPSIPRSDCSAIPIRSGRLLDQRRCHRCSGHRCPQLYARPEQCRGQHGACGPGRCESGWNCQLRRSGHGSPRIMAEPARPGSMATSILMELSALRTW